MWRPASPSIFRRITPYFSAWIQENSRLLSSSSAIFHKSPASPSLSPDAVLMTESCIQRMKELQSSEESSCEKMLRLSVETGGCSGFQYVFDLDESTNSDDRIFEKDGVKLVVDSISYDFVKGATVDYVEELIRSAFQHGEIMLDSNRGFIIVAGFQLVIANKPHDLFTYCPGSVGVGYNTRVAAGRGLINGHYVTTNPSAVGGCSCKSSFVVKQ